MASKPGFFDYLTAAFNARPIGMFVAPNWIGLAAIGLLGLANPGFWVLGAGLELGYLFTLATNRRFQQTVTSKPLNAARSRVEHADPEGARQARSGRPPHLRCAVRALPLDPRLAAPGRRPSRPRGSRQQAESLGRLSWMFLRLLLARRTISQVMGGAQNDAELQRKIASLERQQHQPGLERGARRAASAASWRSCASGCSSAPKAIASSPTSKPSSNASSSRSS